ncbi:MAG: Gp49 family protein [Aeromonadaceae bacterium]
MDIEKEIKDAGLNAPRVTPSRINDVIKSEVYFTASNGVTGATNGKISHDSTHALSLLTFCVITLENGFTVTGESACASPENFNAEIGRKIARENAVNKIWMLEGYLLKQKLSEI